MRWLPASPDVMGGTGSAATERLPRKSSLPCAGANPGEPCQRVCSGEQAPWGMGRLRVAPLGANFAADFEKVVSEARYRPK